MLQDESETKGRKEVYAVDAVYTPEPAPRPNIGIGLLAAFLLFQAIGSFLALVALPIEHALGYMRDLQDSPGSPIWLVGWSFGAAFVWGTMKPSPKVWTIPFGLITCFCFLALMGRADTQEEQLGLDAGKIMFVICALITAVGIVRVTLGEGRQQKTALKQMITGVDSESPAVPQSVLLRASSPPQSPHETLLRPTQDKQDTAPEQLLRASHPENQ